MRLKQKKFEEKQNGGQEVEEKPEKKKEYKG